MNSQQTTIKHACVSNFRLHLYYDYKIGYVLETNVSGFIVIQILSREDANKLEEQLNQSVFNNRGDIQ